jgi:hypothetical protein
LPAFDRILGKCLLMECAVLPMGELLHLLDSLLNVKKCKNHRKRGSSQQVIEFREKTRGATRRLRDRPRVGHAVSIPLDLGERPPNGY